MFDVTSLCHAQYYGQGGLSMGAGAGIAIGVIAFVGVLLAFAALWRRRTSRCAMRPCEGLGEGLRCKGWGSIL